MSYTCPMHRDILSDKPGKCPQCEMKLVLKSSLEKSSQSKALSTYKPLVVIISLILLVTISLSIRDYMTKNVSIARSMEYFMGGFFLVFSGFKFLDLEGFAAGFSTYDILAKRVFVYGKIYPFIELFLGICLAAGYAPIKLSIFVFIFMAFSGVGVWQKIQKKEKIECACLGTFLKVPLSKITLVEDFGMAAMSLLMILFK